MSFVNEFIPPDDVKNYGLKAIDAKFVMECTNARDWTIDRERDIYLRNVANGGGPDPDSRNQTKWTFYWRGTPIFLRLDLIEGRGGRGEAGWSHWKLVWVNGNNGLPEHLKEQKAEILDDLRESLTAYQGAGIYSAAYASYSVTLALDEGCVL